MISTDFQPFDFSAVNIFIHLQYLFIFSELDELDMRQQLLFNSVPSSTPLPDDATEYPFLRGMQLVPRLPVEDLNVIRQQQELLQQDIQKQQQQGQIPVLDLSRNIPYSGQTIRLFKREDRNSTAEKTQKKRTAFEFGVFPGMDLSGLFQGDGFPLGTGFIGDGFFSDPQQSEVKLPKKWSEPAEWEVMAIMALCSGCGEDPFRKATVLSWRETSKKLFAGALYVPAAQQCHHF